MELLNEQIESLLLDVGIEGLGTAAGMALLWGCFFGGTFALFHSLLDLLAGTI